MDHSATVCVSHRLTDLLEDAEHLSAIFHRIFTGRADMAQAGGADATRAEQAVEAARNILGE